MASRKKTTEKYADKDLLEAVAAVKSRCQSVREALDKYGVPRSYNNCRWHFGACMLVHKLCTSQGLLLLCFKFFQNLVYK